MMFLLFYFNRKVVIPMVPVGTGYGTDWNNTKSAVPVLISIIN